MESYKLCMFVLLSMVAMVLAKPADADSDPPPLDCPENEMYLKCQLVQCFKTCDHLLNMPPCPSIASGCIDPACVCMGGYKRNAEGVCVPEEKCPEWPQVLERNEKYGYCPENEVYFKCKLFNCQTTCDHLIHIPPCPSIAAGCVQPACLCKDGYLRNGQGVCVNETECPEWAQVIERNEEAGWTTFPKSNEN